MGTTSRLGKEMTDLNNTELILDAIEKSTNTTLEGQIVLLMLMWLFWMMS